MTYDSDAGDRVRLRVDAVGRRDAAVSTARSVIEVALADLC